MKIDKIMMAAVAGTGLAFASSAQAQNVTVSDLIRGQEDVLFSDDAGQEIVKGAGNTNQSRIQVGDTLTGVFGVNFGRTGSGASRNNVPLLHAVGNQELTGSFALLVTDKTRISDGNDGVAGTPDDEYSFTFGAADSFANGNNTLFRLYVQDPDGTSFVPNLFSTKAQARAATTDGDFYAGVGLANSGNAFNAVGSDFFGRPSAIDPSANDLTLIDVGSSLFALDITESGNIDGGDALDNFPLQQLTNAAGTGTFIGAALIRGPEGPWDLSSDFNFELSVIPTPAAVGPGLALLGLLMARRRRQA